MKCFEFDSRTSLPYGWGECNEVTVDECVVMSGVGGVEEWVEFSECFHLITDEWEGPGSSNYCKFQCHPRD